MKLNLECVPCFQRQALKAMENCELSEKEQEVLLKQIMEKLLEIDWTSTPPQIAHAIHKMIRDKCGDPYRKSMDKHNSELLERYGHFKQLTAGEDWLEKSIKLAIAGNIIDFGPMKKIDVDGTVKRVMGMDLGGDFEIFKEKLDSAKTLLYFHDNAGEIVFDKLLIERLLTHKKFDKVTLVLKGGPILNDATMIDAEQVGLDKLPVDLKFIDNGDSDYPERWSAEVRQWTQDYDLVIAKGQGNYEDMNAFPDLFFMLMVKCHTVAPMLNAEEGDIALKYSGRPNRNI